MSIQSEIDRISTAKAALTTSLVNKGVTIPDGTLLEDYSTLVDSISTGGG